MQQSTSTQNQLDDLIIHSGTSDAEVIQARMDEKGHTHNTLKKRIDDSFDEVTSQLAQTERMVKINSNFTRYGKLKFPVGFNKNLPFDLYRDFDGMIKHTFDINTLKAVTSNVYLKRQGGDDSN